jgi:hypothetical protein
MNASERTGMKRIGHGIRKLFRSNSQGYDVSDIRENSPDANKRSKLKNRFSFRSLGSLEPVLEVKKQIFLTQSQVMIVHSYNVPNSTKT